MNRVPRIRRPFRAAAGLAVLLFLSGCPGGPGQIDPGTSYPQLGEAKPTRDQRSALVIFTATFTDLNMADDSGTMIRHSGYTIYTEKGAWLEYVRNYVGLYDTEPTQIGLEPGRYLILLDTPEKQPPIFKVVVAPGKITTVKLPR